MYWAYLVLFILAIFVPDFVKGGIYSFPHERLEELLIFSFGVIGFLIFIFKEHQLIVKEFEGKKIIKKLFNTNKELEASYTYIGEVNRKLDILMQVGLGLIKHGRRARTKEREAYDSILSAAVSLLKAKNAVLRFVDVGTNKTQKEMFYLDNCHSIKNDEFLEMGEHVNIKKGERYVIASSFKNINNIKCYLIVEGCAEGCAITESENVTTGNNDEILKFLASHALFLYA